MKTIRVKFHHEDSGLCQTTFVTVDEPRRYFNRTDGNQFGCWYTVYPSQGYWENSSVVSSDVSFEIFDDEGVVLFAESNDNLGAFSSIGEKAKEVAAEYSRNLNLKTFAEWKTRVSSDMGKFSYDDYIENWLYYEVESKGWRSIGEYSHLGIKFAVIEARMMHRISGIRWIEVYIENQKISNCEAICGYIFDEEMKNDGD